MEKVISLIHAFSQTADFEALVRPHLLRLYRLAYRLTGSSADAEDLVQDVLVKIYPKKQELAAIEKLGPWLAKVLYRTFLDQQRRHKRSPLHLLAQAQEADCDLLDFIASPGAGPEEISEQEETNRRLQAAINTLNPDQRHLCLLYYVEGYTLAELSEILDTPVGTLKSRIHRSREALRNLLDQGTLSTE
jgi:RNA polymerase sigma-70 factor (ECF subfamily)